MVMREEESMRLTRLRSTGIPSSPAPRTKMGMVFISDALSTMANLISWRGSLVMATAVDYSGYLLPRGTSFPFASVTPASVEGRHHSCLFSGFIKRFP
jgi:hypothetical protein